MKSPRAHVPVLLALLVLAADLSTLGALAQDSPAVPGAPSPSPPSSLPTTPTIEQAKKDLDALMRSTLQQLNRTLESANVTLPGLLPSTTTLAFRDDLDQATHGGIGNWTQGPEWREVAKAGRADSAGWTITNESGVYRHMDSMLVTPAIDLSAYLPGSLPGGASNVLTFSAIEGVKLACNLARTSLGAVGVPIAQNQCEVFSNALDLASAFVQQCRSQAAADGTTIGLDAATCATVAQNLPAGHLVERLVILTFEQRYQLPVRDGGQVWLYTQDPRVNPTARVMLRPMHGYSQYREDVGSLGGPGFSGVSDWSLAAFDLTPWAGSTVWIGFRAATSSLADKDPTYFSRGFDAPIPPGWAIDNVEVRAPAYASDVKLYSIEGPRFRIDEKDHFDRVRPGSNVTVETVVLHSAANPEKIRLTTTVEGLDAGMLQLVEERRMEPGEVWRAPVSFRAPEADGTALTVSAFAEVFPIYTNGTTTDVTANNRASLSMMSSAVPRYDLSFAPSGLMVDDNETVTVHAKVVNTGNVPIEVEVSLNQSFIWTTRERNNDSVWINSSVQFGNHTLRNVSVEPGENESVSWTLTAWPRGSHTLVVRGNSTGLPEKVLPPQQFHVHASPPPILTERTGVHGPGWERAIATLPIPQDESMWVARAANNYVPILVGRPSPTAAGEGSGGFRDLRIDLRWMAYGNPTTAVLKVVYTNPVGAAKDPGKEGSITVWNQTLDVVSSNDMLPHDENLSWHTSRFNVIPAAGSAYFDVWSLQGLEVRIIPAVSDPTGGNGSGFFVDDLRLTGVPAGLDESYRVDIVHISGQATDDGVAPQPTNCQPELPQAGPTGSINCWRRMTKEDARHYASVKPGSLWKDHKDAVFDVDGMPAIWSYVGTANDRVGAAPTVKRDSDRLTTPVLRFRQAVDPVLTFDHTYEFPGYPKDGNSGPTYTIGQIGYVEIQWLQDDGTWSDFRTIYPDGYDNGYPVARSPNGTYDQTPTGRQRVPDISNSYAVGQGYFYPSPCKEGSNRCAPTGEWINNFFDDQGSFVLVPYDDPPVERATFHLNGQPKLAGVNLTNRDVRIGFRASTTGDTVANPGAEWTIGNLRITPVSVFALDGAIDQMHPEVAYDWKTLGVGPGTVVPINVTVRNAGLYPLPFTVRLEVGELNGGSIMTVKNNTGVLSPGQMMNLTIPWQVPLVENRVYTLRATLVSAAEDAEDENDYNDEVSIGFDGSLRARTRADLSIQGAISPEAGRAGLPRHVPVFLHNLGNVPLEDVKITRKVEQIVNGRLVPRGSITFVLSEDLPADPRPTRMEDLFPKIAGRAFETVDGFFTPTDLGTYVVTITATSGRADGTPDDNLYRGTLIAREAIYATDFDSRITWTLDKSGVWTQAEGFLNSPGSLAAADPSTGTLPPNLDATATSPVIPLSRAQSATVNLFAKYDFERRYDGARLEVSRDGVEWIPVPPMTPGPDAYPVDLAASNPLADPSDPEAGARGLSGSSREELVHLNGWVPLSFDLASVPGLAEEVPFRELAAPRTQDGSVVPDTLLRNSYYAPWMVEDHASNASRWVVTNLTEKYVARQGSMWWTDYASRTQDRASADASEKTLSRTFELDGLAPGATLRLSWWDMRAGALGSSWTGTSGIYAVRVLQEDDEGKLQDIADPDWFRPTERDGPWTRVVGDLRNVRMDRPVTLSFSFKSYWADVTDLGWGVDDIDFRAVAIDKGAEVVLRPFTEGDETDWSAWSANWRRVPQIPAVTSPTWRSVVASNPDGLERPMWRVDVPTSGARRALDTRLVTPEVNLADLGSSSASLRLTHRYDLSYFEGVVPSGYDTWANRAYQAATVEIQVFNQSRGTWDSEWKQLWAADPPQAGERDRPRTLAESDGLPYLHTLPDAGDTFQRFPRVYYQKVGVLVSPPPYYAPHVANVSYAFSGASEADGPNGFTVDRLDLSPYVGQKVRFGFHLWTSPADPFNGAHFWQIGKAEVIGTVLSAPDVRLRLRVGTDGSALDGSFAVDQLEITGVTYDRSVGIEVDREPTAVAPDGFVTVRGTIRNYGEGTRSLVGVGLVQEKTPYATANVLNGTKAVLSPGSRYAAVATFKDLQPAGRDGSTRRFEIVAAPGLLSGEQNITLEVVDPVLRSDGRIDFDAAPDDVPGRARRSYLIDIVSRTSFLFEDVVPSPRYLAGPGPVSFTGRLVSNGTTAIAPQLDVTLLNETGVALPMKSFNLSVIPPFGNATFTTPSFTLPAVGNYTALIAVRQTGDTWDDILRVGRGDLAFQEGFDRSAPNWTLNGFRVTDDESFFGNGSLLLGVNNSQLAGLGPHPHSADEDPNLRNGEAISPLVSLAHALPDAVLEFWHKPRMGPQGVVTVVVSVPSRACTSEPLGAPILGSQASWSLVRIPLAGVTCGGEPVIGEGIRVHFRGSMMDEQGWRLDGFTVTSGKASFGPSAIEFPLTDSARKVFPFLVTNEGRAPKSYRLVVDEATSKLTPEQAAWLTVEPGNVTLAPGESRVVRLVVQPPAARGSFPQQLVAVVAAIPLDEPFTLAGASVRFAFEPKPRQDLVVSASVDGRAAVDGLGVEEGVPHEVAAVVLNAGLLGSGPTEVELRLVEQATGREVFAHREEIPALPPYGLSEESAVISASWTPPFGHRGNHTLHVVVDPDRRQVDYDRSNDDVQIRLRVTPLIRPDVVVDPKTVRITTPDGRVLHEAVPGQLVRLTGSVRNDGLATAHDVTVRIFAGGTVLKEEAVGSMEPGQVVSVQATQFAPANATTYSIQATTPDLELSTANNGRSILLPVFPPELRIEANVTDLGVTPGVQRIVPVRVANDGLYPVVLDVTADGLAGQAILSEDRLALGPGESRNLTLTLRPRADEPAGGAPIVLRARAEDGQRAQLTLDAAVAAIPKADAVTFSAGGPPHALAVEFDAVNLGNVALRGEAVLVDEVGREAGRVALPDVAPGSVRSLRLEGSLPPQTPPGARNMTIRFREGGADVGSVPVRVDVAPWSDARLVVAAVAPARETAFHYDLEVRYDGNAPTVRQPRLFGLPSGAKATFNVSQLAMRPGETRSIGVDIVVPRGTTPGLYEAEAALLDPAQPVQDALGNLTSLPLDLRASRLSLVAVRRVPTEAVSEGDTPMWVVKVRNDGDAPARGVPLELYADGVLAGREAVDLEPAQTREFRLTWNATGGTHAIVVAIDPHGEHAEDAPAYGESLHVATSVLGGVAAKQTPGVSGLFAILVVLAVAIAWRGRPRKR